MVASNQGVEDGDRSAWYPLLAHVLNYFSHLPGETVELLEHHRCTSRSLEVRNNLVEVLHKVAIMMIAILLCTCT